MLEPNDRLRPNDQEVASQLFDGEAILVHLANGVYYSMDKVGGLIWQLIEQHHSLEEIARIVVQHHDTSLEIAEKDVRTLMVRLLEENLVLRSDRQESLEASPDPGDTLRQPYESPELISYNDLQDLLALDPPMPDLSNAPWKDD